jgi:nicotinamide-nucleotide amidase
MAERTTDLAPRVRPDRGAPLHVELILVGRDLLRGQVGDRNARVVADAATDRGGLVHRVTVVDDDEPTIAATLREALDRNPHLVVTTGGLGPASDDRTLSAVATVLRRPLSMSGQARRLVEEAYQRLHSSRVIDRAGLDRYREKLCKIPVGGTPVANPIGLAPGVVCRLPGGSAVLCLPGRPEETKAVLESALTDLKDLAHPLHVAQREVESPTADEASLRPLLDQLAEEHPEVRISTRPVGSGRKGSKVLVVLEASSPTEQQAAEAIETTVSRLLAIAIGNR